MNCDCDCHKKDAGNELRKCREAAKRSKAKIEAMQKRMLVLTIVIAIIGTLVGRAGLDQIAEYFESIDKVKQGATKLIGRQPDPNFMPSPFPAPSTGAIFALWALMPTSRRK